MKEKEGKGKPRRREDGHEGKRREGKGVSEIKGSRHYSYCRYGDSTVWLVLIIKIRTVF